MPTGTLSAAQVADSDMKRAIDVLISFTALIVLSPVLLGIGVLILLTSGRPVLFLQDRPGLGGRTFRLIKFRTMTRTDSVEVDTETDGSRLTRLGRILRATSLDELPELWNVLRGDMSLVGPRPLLTEYLPLYTPEQARRHEVRPGITGWAQVNGRNAVDWETRFELDTWYVDNRTLLLDMLILFKTIYQVVRIDQTRSPGHQTQEKFGGSKP